MNKHFAGVELSLDFLELIAAPDYMFPHLQDFYYEKFDFERNDLPRYKLFHNIEQNQEKITKRSEQDLQIADDFLKDEGEQINADFIDLDEQDTNGFPLPFDSRNIIHNEKLIPFATDMPQSYGSTNSLTFAFNSDFSKYSSYEFSSRMFETNNNQTLFDSNSATLIEDETIVFSTGEGFLTDSLFYSKLTSASKLICDPLNKSRFFFVTNDGSSVYSVQYHHKTFEYKLIKEGIDGFDVSSKFMIFSIKNIVSIYLREDSAIKPNFVHRIRPKSHIYVDDEFFYYYIPHSGDVNIYQGETLVQTLHDVANIFKSNDIIIQFEDGSIAIKYHKFVSPNRPVVCASNLKNILHVWFSLEEPPGIVEMTRKRSQIEDVKIYSGVLVKKVQSEVDSLTEKLQNNIGIFSKKLKDLSETYLEQLDNVESKIEEIQDLLPKTELDISQLIEEEDLNKVFCIAANSGYSVFAALCDNNKLKDAVDDEILDASTIMKITPALIKLLTVQNEYAPIILDALLLLDPEDEMVHISMRKNTNDLNRIASEILKSHDQTSPLYQSIKRLSLLSF